MKIDEKVKYKCYPLSWLDEVQDSMQIDERVKYNIQTN